MKDWFATLAYRERVMVLVCAVFVVVAMLWLLVWKPLDSRHDA